MLVSSKKVGLVFFPAFDWAISPTHPEREERLLYTQDQIREEGLFDIAGIEELKPQMAAAKDIQRVHFCIPDVDRVTTESHRISAGGAMTVAAAVERQEIDKGFALVRPPGHHAMRIVHGARGFCNINIEAVMIEYLRSAFGIDKVAIIDTDCHHGDGTQDIYWHDPDTLFISLHQDGRTLYPGSGFPDERGGPNALGRTLNIPLPPRTSKEGFLYIAREVIRPILDDFRPELIVNSAGQDNHYSDPITNMHFCAQGYAELTSLLNPDIAVLEGGYSIEGALPYVNLGIILAMAGLDYSHVQEPDYDAAVLRQDAQTTTAISRIGDMILDLWKRSSQRRTATDAPGSIARRQRQVYYDTDGIREQQTESISVCSDCAGVWQIQSNASTGYRILAVHIPRKACPACRRQGRDWYQAAQADGCHRVYLQDRENDRFEQYRLIPGPQERY
jgi:acetoin utilization deacetylase AcuC-like enzyme